MQTGNLHRPSLNRRHFLARAGAWTVMTACGLAQEKTGRVPAPRVSISEAFDTEMERFMSTRRVPGGALSVVKDGRLVYLRGYGWADHERKEKVKPESLFRIASISKPFTAVAVLKLVEAGRLDLNEPVIELLGIEPVLRERKKMDDRLKKITVRHFLHHTGGWDSNVSGDPMFRSIEIAHATGVPPPAHQKEIIGYMLGQPLDFEPGTRYAYSNFGYCLLGRVIEKLGRMPYESFVRREVLEPMGIHRMRLGASLEAERAKGEVR